jgi:hypothetical protein
MRRWNDSGRVPFLPPRHGVHAGEGGTIFVGGGGEAPPRAARETKYGGRHCRKNRSKNPPQRSCDPAARRARAVMLHLRARYVSKAAILTIPAPLKPVENRSPA